MVRRMAVTPSSCCFGPGRSISRILLSIGIANAGDHLSRLQVSLQLKQPTRNSTRTSRSRPIANNEICPCLALLLVGVAWPPTLLLTPVVSYNVITEQSRTNSTSELAHLCTLTRLNKFSWAVCFCGPVRQVSPPRELPDTVPCGVRTFLSPTNWAAATRPTWWVNHTWIVSRRQFKPV